MAQLRSPADRQASAPGWTGLVELELEWRRADFTCRAGVYDDGIDEVRVAIENFADRQATEIAAARAAWANTVARRRAGFHGRVRIARHEAAGQWSGAAWLIRLMR
jgi:hypothetical protein